MQTRSPATNGGQWPMANGSYLGVYFLHYTQANSHDLGHFMLASALASIPLGFLLGSLADRHQAHRLVYLASLLLAYLNHCLLLVPILLTATSGSATGHTPPLNVSSAEVVLPVATHATHAAHATIDQDQPLWFYLIGGCLALAHLSSSLNMNISDSFSANAARGRQPSVSFGSLRFFGSIGLCLSALVLSLINKFAHNLPYLLASWLVCLLMGALNLLIVALWPDRRPFDLAERADCSRDEPSLFAPAWTRGNKGRGAQALPLDERPGRPVALVSGRVYGFDVSDSCASEARRPSVRRCSIASLGKSYMCELFTIEQANASESGQARTRGQHFMHIAKIEPVQVGRLKELLARHGTQQQVGHPQLADTRLQPTRLSLRLHLKILELIARRNPNMARFMLLYTAIGFIIAMNWIYLFPYLEQLDATKFQTLSAYLMLSSFISETLFYYVSAHFTSKLSAANGLSLVLLMFALRYLLYLSFALWPNATWWPLELMVLVELLQALTQAWFECIFNESALEFALEAERCVPKLIELKLIENTHESSEQVRNSVKLTLFAVSSASFEGLGVGLGSLLGGWIIHTHGFCALWLICASLALLVCLLNLALEVLPADEAPLPMQEAPSSLGQAHART